MLFKLLYCFFNSFISYFRKKLFVRWGGAFSFAQTVSLSASQIKLLNISNKRENLLFIYIIPKLYLGIVCPIQLQQFLFKISTCYL